MLKCNYDENKQWCTYMNGGNLVEGNPELDCSKITFTDIEFCPGERNYHLKAYQGHYAVNLCVPKQYRIYRKIYRKKCIKETALLLGMFILQGQLDHREWFWVCPLRWDDLARWRDCHLVWIYITNMHEIQVAEYWQHCALSFSSTQYRNRHDKLITVRDGDGLMN